MEVQTVMNGSAKWPAALNIATALFAENQTGGLMVCGLNWGGDPLAAPDGEAPSFFSDEAVNNFPYRNRLARWFDLWGFTLEKNRGREGAFERSIVQTNWLPDQQRTMHGQNVRALCVSNSENFFTHLRELQPRVILFCGNVLIDILNQAPCRDQAEACLGSADRLQWCQKDVVANGKRLKKFRVGFQHFARCEVIGLPHPTGSVGLSDTYVEAFRDEISPILHTFRSGLGRH